MGRSYNGSMDSIRIKGLKLEAICGVHDWERQLPRTVVVDLELATDAAAAARQDRLADALDYAAVAQAVTTLVGASRAQLIETLAEQLATKLREEFRLRWLRVEVHKPGAVPGAADVSVVVERGTR